MSFELSCEIFVLTWALISCDNLVLIARDLLRDLVLLQVAPICFELSCEILVLIVCIARGLHTFWRGFSSNRMCYP